MKIYSNSQIFLRKENDCRKNSTALKKLNLLKLLLGNNLLYYLIPLGLFESDERGERYIVGYLEKAFEVLSNSRCYFIPIHSRNPRTGKPWACSAHASVQLRIRGTFSSSQ